MKLKFIHPTTAQVMRFLSIALTFVNFFLTYAATIQAQAWIPASLAMCWPEIFLVAGFIHQAASTFGIAPDAALATQLNNDALIAAHVAGAVAGAKEALAQIANASTRAVSSSVDSSPFQHSQKTSSKLQLL